MRQDQPTAGSCLPGLTDKSAPFKLSAGIFASVGDKKTAYKAEIISQITFWRTEHQRAEWSTGGTVKNCMYTHHLQGAIYPPGGAALIKQPSVGRARSVSLLGGLTPNPARCGFRIGPPTPAR